jgi:hypothetical protein
VHFPALRHVHYCRSAVSQSELALACIEFVNKLCMVFCSSSKHVG